MKCPDPPAHSSESGSGGFAAPLVFLAAALAFVAFGWVVNLLLIGLLVAAFVLVTGVVVMLLIRAHRQILGGQPRYVPQMTASRPVPPRPAQVQPVETAGQHLHIHLGGLSAVERAEALRQLGHGGQR